MIHSYQLSVHLSFYAFVKLLFEDENGSWKERPDYARVKQPQLGPAPLENLCSYWLNDLQGFVGHKEDPSIGMCFLIPM